MRRAARALLAAGAAALLAGCSQISALAPVGGDTETSVRIAANDVLLERQVPIGVAPVCRAESDRITCAGSTLDGRPIEVTAPDVDPLVVTVSVGGEVLFTGPVQDVIDRNGEATP